MKVKDIIEKTQVARKLIMEANNRGISNYRIESEALGYSCNNLPKFLSGSYSYSETNLNKLIAYLHAELDGIDTAETFTAPDPEEESKEWEPMQEEEPAQEDEEALDQSDEHVTNIENVKSLDLDEESIRNRKRLDGLAALLAREPAQLLNEIVAEYLDRVCGALNEVMFS